MFVVFRLPYVFRFLLPVYFGVLMCTYCVYFDLVCHYSYDVGICHGLLALRQS